MSSHRFFLKTVFVALLGAVLLIGGVLCVLGERSHHGSNVVEDNSPPQPQVSRNEEEAERRGGLMMMRVSCMVNLLFHHKTKVGTGGIFGDWCTDVHGLVTTFLPFVCSSGFVLLTACCHANYKTALFLVDDEPTNGSSSRMVQHRRHLSYLRQAHRPLSSESSHTYM